MVNTTIVLMVGTLAFQVADGPVVLPELHNLGPLRVP